MFVPIFVALLVAQSVVLPLARVRAEQSADLDAALFVLCSSATSHGGEDGDAPRGGHAGDLGCCRLCDRFVLDLPVFGPGRLAVTPPDRPATAAVFVPSRPRAPPPIAETPRQPRAPPSFA